MAKTTNPSIPANLQEQFAELINLRQQESSNITHAQTAPLLTAAAENPDRRKELQIMSIDAAAWLTEAWKKDADKATRSAFYAARFNDIMARQFRAPYWIELTLSRDRVGIAYPVVKSFQGAIDPTYWDPLRQPTDCRYERYNRTYNTPTYPSLGADKSPGWQGEIQNGKFVDLWHAARLLEFSIPQGQRQDTRRPIAIRLDIIIEATATIRGSPTWFTPISVVGINQAPWTPEGMTEIPTNYRREWALKPILPGDSAGGWNHDESLSLWRYGSRGRLERQDMAGNIVTVEIATAPSLGRYFNRNDAVTVTHDESVRVYWPQRKEEA